MDRIHHASALATPPAVDAYATAGYPTEGNPLGGVEATVFTAWMGHSLIEEIRNVITTAGLTPDKASVVQLRDALAALYGGGGTLASNGWQKLPGGLIIQWGNATLPNTGMNTSGIAVTLPLAFPTALYVALSTTRGTARVGGWVPATGVLTASLSSINVGADVLADSAGQEFNQTCPVSWFAIGR